MNHQDPHFSLVLFRVNAFLQMSSAALSLLCSSMMAFMINRSERGLSTPYRRIIFGLSILGIFQSLIFLFGPFLVPSDTPASWGMGNDTICQVQGSFLLFGGYAIPMYMCFLSFYYLCKLKYHMTNDGFAHAYEMKIHFVVITIAASIAIVGFIADGIHPLYNRTACGLAVTPPGCRFYPEVFGECDPTIEPSVNTLVLVTQSFAILNLLGLLVMAAILYRHVISFHHIYQPMFNFISVTKNTSDVDDATEGQLQHRNQIQATQAQTCNQSITHLSKIYRNEVALEATFYIGAFSLTHAPIFVLYFLLMVGDRPPAFLSVLAAILSPLGGLINIFVYTRQYISSLQRHDPALTWSSGFWIVVKAGGEVPLPHPTFALSSLREREFDLPSDFESLDETPPPQISEEGGSKNQNQFVLYVESKPARRFYFLSPSSSDESGFSLRGV